MSPLVSSQQESAFKKAVCQQSALEDVVAYIHGEMKKNEAGADVHYIRENLTPGWDDLIPGKGSIDVAQAFKRWYDLVKSGAPWDHKPVIKKKYGEWSCDFSTKIYYRFDIWSNIHYGYVGLAAGFSEWVLLSGAGAAQFKDGNTPDGYWSRRAEKLGDADVFAALDDPLDQAAIEIGFQLWKSYGAKVTKENILGEVRSKSSQLATSKCTFNCTISQKCLLKSQIVIVIDPGHGDVFDKSLDPGAVWSDPKTKTSEMEKDLALAVSKELRGALLKVDSVRAVYLTREGDITQKQKRFVWRTNIAKQVKAHLFISVHLNSAGAKATGHTIYHHPASSEGKKLATAISSNYIKIQALGGAGVKAEKHAVTGNLNGTSVKAAVLIEVGFITNDNDRSIIKTGAAQIATEIATGVEAYIKESMSDLYINCE